MEISVSVINYALDRAGDSDEDTVYAEVVLSTQYEGDGQKESPGWAPGSATTTKDRHKSGGVPTPSVNRTLLDSDSGGRVYLHYASLYTGIKSMWLKNSLNRTRTDGG